jgi:hypothetical protein
MKLGAVTVRLLLLCRYCYCAAVVSDQPCIHTPDQRYLDDLGRISACQRAKTGSRLGVVVRVL